MYSLNQVNKLVSCGRDPARSLPFWRGFLLIPLILVCFAFAPQTRAVTPAPDGGYAGFNTAEGDQALQLLFGGFANTALGWRSNFSAIGASFNTGAGAGTLVLNTADINTAVGAAALLLNTGGGRNTAVGGAAMVFNAGDADGNGSFNDAVGAFSLNANTTGFSNNAVGDSALELNTSGAENTAIGDLALRNNDATGSSASFNTAAGSNAMFNNVTGSSNTVVGAHAGSNIAGGFNNTYVGQFVGDNSGTPIPDENLTIRIADFSTDGFGSAACFIGGIFANEQEANGDNIVVVTLNLDDDHLGFDPTIALNGARKAPHTPQRNAPQPRMRPQPHHQAMLNDKVETLQATLAQQQATLAQQQKQIETLTAQLREQAAQIQNVSAQLEMVRPAPRVVNNH
jgi:uncharacterized coiled-coil protein SlyX